MGFHLFLISFAFAGPCSGIGDSVQSVRLNLNTGEILAPIPAGKNIVRNKAESLFGNVQPVNLGQVQALRWIAKHPWALKFNQLIVSSGRLQSGETHAVPFYQMKKPAVESSLKNFLGGQVETSDGPKRTLSDALEISYDKSGLLEKIEKFSSATRISLNYAPEALKLIVEISFIRTSRGREKGILIENHSMNEFFNSIGAVLQAVDAPVTGTGEKGIARARELVKNWHFRFFRYLDLQKIENVMFQVVDFGTTINGRSQLESKLDSKYKVSQFSDLGIFGNHRWVEIRQYQGLKQPRVGKRDSLTSSLILAYEATPEGFSFRGIVEASGHRFEQLETDPQVVKDTIDAVVGEKFTRALAQEFVDVENPKLSLDESVLRTTLETALLTHEQMSFSDIHLPIFVQSTGFDRNIPYKKRMTPLEKQKWPFSVAIQPR